MTDLDSRVKAGLVTPLITLAWVIGWIVYLRSGGSVSSARTWKAGSDVVLNRDLSSFGLFESIPLGFFLSMGFITRPKSSLVDDPSSMLSSSRMAFLSANSLDWSWNFFPVLPQSAHCQC